MRLHSFTDKQKIMYATRNKGRIKVEKTGCDFYRNFSAEVVRRRRESANTRKLLHEAGTNFSFMYPAEIRMSHPIGTTSSLSIR